MEKFDVILLGLLLLQAASFTYTTLAFLYIRQNFKFGNKPVEIDKSLEEGDGGYEV